MNFKAKTILILSKLSTAAKPYTFVLKDGNGKQLKELQNNDDQPVTRMIIAERIHYNSKRSGRSDECLDY